MPDITTTYRRAAVAPSRTHITDTPVGPLIDVSPMTGAPRIPGGGEDSFKPRGLWYEVDGDWRRWCRDEGWQSREHLLLYDINLSRCRILRIESGDALLTFGLKYARSVFRSITYPDWGRLAAEGYDGLEIAPYQWEHRLSMLPQMNWYYSWDCASGVVWNASKASVVLREEWSDPKAWRGTVPDEVTDGE